MICWDRTLDANRRGGAYALHLIQIFVSKCVKHEFIIPRVFVSFKNYFYNL